MKGTFVSKPYLQNQQFHFITLGIAWILLHCLLFYQFGIVTNFEAAKYIEQARLLIETGSYSTNNFIFYSTQILLIALCTKLGIGLWLVVMIQLFMNALSIYLFYRLVCLLTENKVV